MNTIDEIISELKNIRGAFWTEDSDPFKRPRIPPEGMQKLESSEKVTPVFNSVEDFHYPEWVEQEIFSGIDQRVLGRETGNVFSQGIDALAWYVSFHQTSGHWGVFIPISSLAYFESRYLLDVKLSRFRKWQVCFEMLFEHELFHFATDYMCAQWEILMQAPCWSSLTDRRLKSGKYIEVEEKLANAYMLRMLEPEWEKSVRLAVRRFVAAQPIGYHEGLEFIGEDRFDCELVELTKTYIGLHQLERGLNPWTATFSYQALFPVRPGVNRNICPLFIIHDETRLKIPQISVEFIRCIPKIIETSRFTKSLANLSLSLQRRWENKKAQLAGGIPRHPEFEKLKGQFEGQYSIRLSQNYRVHLQPIRDQNIWKALDVGTHTQMRHG